MPSRVSAWSVYDIFDLADDAQLFIAAVSDRQFEILCDVLEHPELKDEPDFKTNTSRVHARPRLLKRLAAILQDHRVGELAAASSLAASARVASDSGAPSSPASASINPDRNSSP